MHIKMNSEFPSAGLNTDRYNIHTGRVSSAPISIGVFGRLEQIQYQYPEICKIISALEERLAPVLLPEPSEPRNTEATRDPETELERRIAMAQEQMGIIAHKLEQLYSRIVI